MKELELKQILAEALKSGANFAEIFIEEGKKILESLK